jgi:hypothetical protein
MSHAAAVWIPGNTHDPRRIEALVSAHCEHEALDFDLATRATPPTTCLVAPLDERDELQMDFELLNQTAAALARALRTPTYALYGFFGSGDFLMINAFSASGAERWSAGSEDDDPKAPYWKMLEEVAPGFTADVLGLCVKPAFDLGFIDGWRASASFVAMPSGADEVADAVPDERERDEPDEVTVAPEPTKSVKKKKKKAKAAKKPRPEAKQASRPKKKAAGRKKR